MEWISTAFDELLAVRNQDGGWPFRAGEASHTEATALGRLTLALVDPEAAEILSAEALLQSRQLNDGHFSLYDTPVPATWVTPLAAMAIANVTSRTAAADALLNTAAFVPDNPTVGLIYGYDTTIPGWAWTHGDYSFTEPTALALLFLKQHGLQQHPRVRQAVQMLQARSLSGGGWNYGEPNVLGSDLFPAAVPTALAVMALADEPEVDIAPAIQWLRSQQGQMTSLMSLGWTTMALNVLGQLDDDWRQEVVGRWSALPPERRGGLGTILCLLGLTESENHPFKRVQDE